MYCVLFLLPSAPEDAVGEIGELVDGRVVDIGNVAASLDGVLDSLLATGQVASPAFTDVRTLLNYVCTCM